MDSSVRGDMTPRRSTRLQQKQREKTPEQSLSAYKPRGPRAMAKLNKSKLNKSVPAIIITSPDKEKKEEPVQKQETAIIDPVESKQHPGDLPAVPDQHPEEIKIDQENQNPQKEPQEVAEEIKTDEVHETYAEVVAHGSQYEPQNHINAEKMAVNEEIPPKDEENLLNTTPPLMDESVISVPESIENTIPPKDATFSPEPNNKTQDQAKDSTFSPIADKSIHDSRPHIDIETEFNTTPIPRNITHRTSTPLAQKLLKRDTPKAGSSAMAALAKVFSPKPSTSAIEALNETVNGQMKVINPLERSILKSTRKRSLSVTDGESFVQKKVMFISPKVMDIGEIDERMMQSFREEKEISMRVQMSGTRRKRSLSASETPIAAKKKTPMKQMPDFKAIHVARFKKMESIVEHKERKAERAKKLITPSKSLPTESASTSSQSQQPAKVAAASKIPKSSRVPLATKPQTDNAKNVRPLKRSVSAEPQSSQIKKPAFVSTLSRAMSQETATTSKLKFPTIKSKSQTVVQERREKNMSLYKTNVTRTGTADIRKKNETFIKGVRLNRRFELMMQNRMAHDAGEHADD